MSAVSRINAKLQKAFGNAVSAREERGCVVLSGELERWDDVVAAGRMAVNQQPRRKQRGMLDTKGRIYGQSAPRGGVLTLMCNKKKYIGVVNDIACTGETPAPPRLPSLRDSALEGARPDVLVIGGGVVGCAIARELMRWRLDVLLVEKEHDLALGASGRNDGMVHAGIDLSKKSQKHKYNSAGNRMYGDICAELGVDFCRTGQFICFNKSWWKPLLYLTLPYWKSKGIPGVSVVGKKELHEAEPGLSPQMAAALHFPSTGEVCPHNVTIAFAENAVQNGATVSLDTAVLSMDVRDGEIKSVTTNRGAVYPKVVINAAGVFCEEISKLARDRFYSIHPRKGTNAILDKKYSDAVVRTAVSSIGTVSTTTTHSKGGGIIRTVHGNTLVGPDAVETVEKEDFSTTRESIAGTFAKQGQADTALNQGQVITYFSGVRGPTYEEDFVVCAGKFTKNIVHAAGIQSPGLTAAPAIGAEVAKIAAAMLDARPNPNFDPIRKPIPHVAALPDEERAALIAQNPDYGVIVCRCEEVSKGEILDALRRPIPCHTVDGVKRRVRPGMGRCQGGFCGPLVLGIIAEEKGLAPSKVTKNGEGSGILFGKTK